MSLLSPAMASAGEGCTCRANGQDYIEGQIICIRGQLARCEMVLNNTSWKIISEQCPEVKFHGRQPFIAALPRLPRSSLPSC